MSLTRDQLIESVSGKEPDELSEQGYSHAQDLAGAAKLVARKLKAAHKDKSKRRSALGSFYDLLEKMQQVPIDILPTGVLGKVQGHLKAAMKLVDSEYEAADKE